MLDDDLRRLAEIGIDVYLPRGGAAAAHAIAPGAANADHTEVTKAAAVVVLAATPNARAEKLLADVLHALAAAKVHCVHGDIDDESAIAVAPALVMFGESPLRAVGARIPAVRQSAIGWVAAADLATLARDPSAKRALWSELKRMARGLVGGAPAMPL